MNVLHTINLPVGWFFTCYFPVSEGIYVLSFVKPELDRFWFLLSRSQCYLQKFRLRVYEKLFRFVVQI